MLCIKKNIFIAYTNKHINVPPEIMDELKENKQIEHNAPPYINDLSPIRRESVVDIAIKKNIKREEIPDSMVVPKKDIIISPIVEDKELRKLPTYMDYYNRIREKIRLKAYQYYDGKSKGYVSINFVLSNKGELVSIYCDKNNSSASDELIEISLKSIKESSPFGNFPEDLMDREYISFNIFISFKSN